MHVLVKVKGAIEQSPVGEAFIVLSEARAQELFDVRLAKLELEEAVMSPEVRAPCLLSCAKLGVRSQLSFLLED